MLLLQTWMFWLPIVYTSGGHCVPCWPSTEDFSSEMNQCSHERHIHGGGECDMFLGNIIYILVYKTI